MPREREKERTEFCSLACHGREHCQERQKKVRAKRSETSVSTVKRHIGNNARAPVPLCAALHPRRLSQTDHQRAEERKEGIFYDKRITDYRK